MKAWLAGCVILLGVTGCASTAQQSAEQIYQQREALRAMWPGYDPLARGVGYYHSKDGYVILALEAAPPPHFSQLSPGVWRSDNAYPHLRQSFYINTPLHDTRATLVSYPQVDSNSFTLLFHEDFHGYQRDNFADQSGSTLARFDIGQMPINTLVAALRTERSLLMAALEADESKHLEQVLLYYAGLRLWREAQLPIESVTTERRNETDEGTANWIGYRATQVLLGESDREFIEGRKRLLEHDYEDMEASTSMRLVTGRVYSTGAALTELLPKGTEFEWQAIVEQKSATLFDMLLQAFQWPQSLLDAAGEEIIASQEFARAIDTASELSWADSEEAVLAGVESQYRWKLSVELPIGATGGFSAIGGAVTQLPDNSLLLHPVQQFDIETDLLSVAIRDRNIVLSNSSLLIGRDEVEKMQQTLTLYLDKVDSSLHCSDGEHVCEGSLATFAELGVRIQSEAPLPYQLKRLNQ